MLQQLPKLADRFALVEALGSHALGVVQYVDDATAPCPSIGAVAAITRRDADTACNRYARKVRAEFNYGPNKTAVMALLNSPAASPDAVGCDSVASYRLLGCLIDSDLIFAPMLCEAKARAWAQFLELFHAAESIGFSVPILAAQVPVRVLPGLLFLAPFLAVAPRMQFVLDKLQVDMAQHILGCPGVHIKWQLIWAQRG